MADWSAYFETCRRKRNVVDYDKAEVATASEADELVEKVEMFRDQVEQWIRLKHPELT